MANRCRFKVDRQYVAFCRGKVPQVRYIATKANRNLCVNVAGADIAGRDESWRGIRRRPCQRLHRDGTVQQRLEA